MTKPTVRAFRAGVWFSVVALVALMWSFPGVVKATSALQTDAAFFDALAGELIQGLKRHDTHGNTPRPVAIWPLRPDKVPVPEGLARSWSDMLLDALVRGNDGILRFVTRADLAKIIEEMGSTDLFGEIDNPVATIVGNAKVDILVIGKALSAKGGVFLSYRAIEVQTGTILATTQRRFLPVNFSAIEEHKDSLTLEAAVDVAATKFAELGPNLKRLRVQGVREGNSHVQGPFGSYVALHVADALQARMDNPLTDDHLMVMDAEIEPLDLMRMRGVNVTPREMRERLTGNVVGDYLLSGTYWDFGRLVALRLSVRNSEGVGFAWSHHILKSSIPKALRLLPKVPVPGAENNDNLGPIGLELTSNKGRDPVFRIGEEMVLLVRTTEDAFLYCFYTQADGRRSRIYPNPYQLDARVPGRVLQLIPSPSMKFDFLIAPPTGVEWLKCFATNHDLANHLPPWIQAMTLRPVSGVGGASLVRGFREIRGVKMSEASLVVTVRD